MKLLLDQGLPRSTIQLLRDMGVVAEHVGDIGMAAATDADILDAALERDAVVVTLDSDFHSLLASRAATRPSVIRIRMEGLRADAAASVIVQVLEVAKEDIELGAAVSVTASNICVRRLPLGRKPKQPR